MFDTGVKSAGLRVRLAGGAADRARVLQLRAQVFRGGRDDEDDIDRRCAHLMVEGKGRLHGTTRILLHERGRDAARGYAARHYDLAPLVCRPGPVLELGRLCTAPGQGGAQIARLIFLAIVRMALASRAVALIGCTSFAGTDPAPHRAALAWIARHHLLPLPLRPAARAAEVLPLDAAPVSETRALRQMPPLLRSYLAMGARLGAQAVIDRDLGTLHLYTQLDVAAVPARRRAALIASARAAGPAIDLGRAIG